ncbi:uncharacterized protein BO96DRAFT_400212 [Aspergillus niger CBS 101883]|uniref:Uncharacterized protein n=2 Tax=Aspergillus niger TaxID=5061 RepID=A2R0Q1_ASPNC|nr:uncharacterized protein BO96DRAFT_400212 [Aspergillus niger CBS 101883]XP_059601968.1 hypothetical protein An12g09380 [Aspergillus niger]PYH53210.1 hypothetical protein BO96DRAFT_400212 [Aspergillus niger CBS 101883]CAK41368.1 hypothetical protein An12g09380 [Aspergillus niger]
MSKSAGNEYSASTTHRSFQSLTVTAPPSRLNIRQHVPTGEDGSTLPLPRSILGAANITIGSQKRSTYSAVCKAVQSTRCHQRSHPTLHVGGNEKPAAVRKGGSYGDRSFPISVDAMQVSAHPGIPMIHHLPLCGNEKAGNSRALIDQRSSRSHDLFTLTSAEVSMTNSRKWDDVRAVMHPKAERRRMNTDVMRIGILSIPLCNASNNASQENAPQLGNPRPRCMMKTRLGLFGGVFHGNLYPVGNARKDIPIPIPRNHPCHKGVLSCDAVGEYKTCRAEGMPAQG